MGSYIIRRILQSFVVIIGGDTGLFGARNSATYPNMGRYAFGRKVLFYHCVVGFGISRSCHISFGVWN